jgi:hypothetical protein
MVVNLKVVGLAPMSQSNDSELPTNPSVENIYILPTYASNNVLIRCKKYFYLKTIT